MILTEQQYKKLNKLYYHGQEFKDRDKTLALFKCYYLATDPYYAYQYATRKGYMQIVKLKKGLDLCNLKSKQDRIRIENYCRKHGILKPLQLIAQLMQNDWLAAFENIEYLNMFIETLQKVGYDGYFNFESKDSLQVRVSKRSKEICSFPSIGVLDENCIQIVKSLHGIDEFLTLPEIRHARDKEIQYVKMTLHDAYETYGILNTEQAIETLRLLRQEITILNSDEILNIVENFDPKETTRLLQEKRLLAREHLRAWNQCEPSKARIEDFVRSNYWHSKFSKVLVDISLAKKRGII